MHSLPQAELRGAVDATVRALMASVDAGEDPRRAIARLNASIVSFQHAGLDMPASFVRLERTLAAECVAQSRGMRPQ